MGIFFLPGTFLSSLFGMPFFSFKKGEYYLSGDRPLCSNDLISRVSVADLNTGTDAVSKSIWIYFALTLPLTAMIVGVWYTFDQRRAKNGSDEDSQETDDPRAETEEERESRLLETRIMRNIRRWTGVRVADTFELRNHPTRS